MLKRREGKQIIGETVEFIDIQIREAMKELSSMDTSQPEYEDALENLAKLHTLRQEVKVGGVLSRISPDAVFAGAVSIVSILAILNYEKSEIVTSKAMSIFTKMIGK